MSSEIVIVALGPVQQFISQARRTSDLYVGSALLSHLAQQGVQTAEGYGGNMIFPVRVNGQLPRSIPNRFVFTTSANGVTIAQAVEQATREAWHNLANAVQNALARHAPDLTWRNIWQRQVENWLELYWTVTPEQGNYKATSEYANRAMAARKLVRHFHREGEPGWKCSVCGEREVLHGPDGRYPAVREYWEALRRSLKQGTLREGERLCAICTIKRLAPQVAEGIFGDVAAFPSTSSIAAASFKADILQHWDTVGRAAEDFAQRAFSLGVPHIYQSFPYLDSQYGQVAMGNPARSPLLALDGEFFYPVAPSEEEGISEQAARQLRQAQRDLFVVTDKAGIPRPHTYLAVLKMDGDHMGKWVSQCQRREEHQHLSAILASYAENDVPYIVEKQYPGRLIYSGGDDVLALLPARYALAAADDLRRTFAQRLEEGGFHKSADFPDRPHASAGIALVHHTHPFGHALEAARRAESAAKHDHGRNAVVVVSLRRSGEQKQAGAKWEPDNLRIADIVGELEQAFASGELARGFPYDLHMLVYATGGNKVPHEAREVLLKRLLYRRVERGKREKVAEAYRNDLAALGKAIGWENMARWVELARFTGQGGER